MDEVTRFLFDQASRDAMKCDICVLGIMGWPVTHGCVKHSSKESLNEQQGYELLFGVKETWKDHVLSGER